VATVAEHCHQLAESVRLHRKALAMERRCTSTCASGSPDQSCASWGCSRTLCRASVKLGEVERLHEGLLAMQHRVVSLYVCVECVTLCAFSSHSACLVIYCSLEMNT
jgi:hypothetical protein